MPICLIVPAPFPLLIAAGVVGLIVWAGSAALDAMSVFPEDWND